MSARHQADGARVSRLNAAWLARGGAGRAGGVALPGYVPADHGVGIVHLGMGAFHRAHQAVYTDDVLAARGGDWRILGVSLRGAAVAADLDPQDGLYTLLTRGAEETSVRVVGSVAGVVAAANDPAPALRALASPSTRIVTLTVTEKAYGIDRASGRIQARHPAVAHDLEHPDCPEGVLGMLVWALGERRRRRIEPFTVLCCDNLPDNGHLLRAGVLDMARRTAPDLAAWIEDRVAFPCSMVDRITPAATARTLADAAAALGCEDRAAVETEPFSMWVIEDRFPAGRPAWELAGALMVERVAPFERMKLRMLNGAHSLLAYAGHVAGFVHVRDAMGDPATARAVRIYLAGAAASLDPLPGLDLDRYGEALVGRFSNPAIAHETYQIAMDGTEKLPQRILLPAADVLSGRGDIRAFAFATAAWMRYCLGFRDDGAAYDLRDPRQAEIGAAVRGREKDAVGLASALMAIDGLFPDALRGSALWTRQVADCLEAMLSRGMKAALADFPLPHRE